jgi:hypothetical protein
MPFLTPAIVATGESCKWVVHKPLLYFSDRYQLTVRVPEGFTTDLASIPRLGRIVIPQNGCHRDASIVHDYLYSIGGKIPGMLGGALTRKECDLIFLEAMKSRGTPRWQQLVMYHAVRVGGIFHWSRA